MSELYTPIAKRTAKSQLIRCIQCTRMRRKQHTTIVLSRWKGPLSPPWFSQLRVEWLKNVPDITNKLLDSYHWRPRRSTRRSWTTCEPVCDKYFWRVPLLRYVVREGKRRNMAKVFQNCPSIPLQRCLPMRVDVQGAVILNGQCVWVRVCECVWVCVCVCAFVWVSLCPYICACVCECVCVCACATSYEKRADAQQVVFLLVK